MLFKCFKRRTQNFCSITTLLLSLSLQSKNFDLPEEQVDERLRQAAKKFKVDYDLLSQYYLDIHWSVEDNRPLFDIIEKYKPLF